MVKEVVVYIHNRILLSYKKSAFESVLLRWMKLESITQSEVSQKEKHEFSILTYIWNLEGGNNKTACHAAKETQM